ncbi:SPO75 [[Candida] subhashii]|uniref:SPO75 n=1 Tax=[Candida] subhashii TaxID=561895 RepID=A0A8J5QI03_9ASCO|nr:SPO75 [[Candida] subhashii]KAG7665999.1 SPO75 [[Candida] subhashii]
MSTITSSEQYDYGALTRSYMGIFNSQRFSRFLNTTQTGAAHSASGLDFGLFMKTLFTSLCFCTIQLTLFCLFRSVFNFLYQPRCFCVPINERMECLPRGFLNWIIPTLKSSINNYLSLGLDAYFFVRYISVLSLFFSVLGTLNMIILIPINATGSNAEYSATGLDKLSLSNISNTKVARLNAHFIMGLLTIGFFHWMIIYEFQSFVTIRQSYLVSNTHRNSIMARTLLISNIPYYLQDDGILRDLFKIVPGGIKNFWEVYDFERIDHEVKKAEYALNILEQSQILVLRKYYNHRYGLLGFRDGSVEDETHDMLDFLHNPKNEILFYPPIYLGLVKVPKFDRSFRVQLAGWLRIFRFEKKHVMKDWAIQTLQDCITCIDEEKLKLANGQLRKHNKTFVEFTTQEGAYIAHQCLLSQSQGHLDKTLIEINPADIIWRNVSRNDGVACKFEKYLVTVVFICIIILYVIPVSLIGLVSQIPLLTQLMPFLKWIYHFPEEARATISGFLPSILLTILTEIVMYTFRFLTYYKGKTTGCEAELDLQKWYFAFLFVQQFLVVTISSSVTVICRQIIDQPTSIPVLLATNLPKSATFFFQYICLRAFAFCGNNFLRIGQLTLSNTLYKIIDNTPRRKFKRVTSLPKIKWGTTFSVYSIYACIRISYSIVSPLISIFIIFFLCLSILYYKYALKYVYSHINESETTGRLYPIALLHLYTGIYCLECCLIGVFFLSKDKKGSYPMRTHGWIMTGILFLTIFTNTLIYNRYIPHFSNLPILSDKIYKETPQKQDNQVCDEPDSTSTYYSNRKLMYLHPAFKYEPPKLWLPKDPLGFTELQIQEIESKIDSLREGQTTGASVTFVKPFHTLKLLVSQAPPDYK